MKTKLKQNDDKQKKLQSRRNEIAAQLQAILDRTNYDFEPFIQAQEAYKANETTGSKCLLAYISIDKIKVFLELIEVNRIHAHRAASLIGISDVTFWQYNKYAEVGREALFTEFSNLRKKAEARREARILAEIQIQSNPINGWPAGYRALESLDKANWAKDQPSVNPLAEGMKFVQDLYKIWNSGKDPANLPESAVKPLKDKDIPLLPPGSTDYARLLVD